MPRAAIRHLLLSVVIMTGTLLSANAANAADREGKFSVRGLGSRTCSTFLAAANEPVEYDRFGSWLLGYVSARNRAEPETYDFIPTEAGTDFPNIVAVVCKTSPEATLQVAADKAIAALAPMRQTVASPLVQLQSEGRTVAIRQDALRTLQQALIRRKLYKGSADGDSNPRFIAALKDLQRKEGLPVTGLPDIDTFIRAILKR